MYIRGKNMLRFQLIKWFSQFHKYVLVQTKGRMMHNLLGHQMLLLENIGRKTSKRHLTPLLYIKSDSNNFLTVGSFGGHPKHPAWFLNIQNINKTYIFIKGNRIQVQISILSGSEKEEAWNKLILEYPGFSKYQKNERRYW